MVETGRFTSDDLVAIEHSARDEIAWEDHRAAVDAAKLRIREWRARPWWKRWLPFTLKIRFEWNWR
jgi:hypothetical protein